MGEACVTAENERRVPPLPTERRWWRARGPSCDWLRAQKRGLGTNLHRFPSPEWTGSELNGVAVVLKTKQYYKLRTPEYEVHFTLTEAENGDSQAYQTVYGGQNGRGGGGEQVGNPHINDMREGANLQIPRSSGCLLGEDKKTLRRRARSVQQMFFSPRRPIDKYKENEKETGVKNTTRYGVCNIFLSYTRHLETCHEQNIGNTSNNSRGGLGGRKAEPPTSTAPGVKNW